MLYDIYTKIKSFCKENQKDLYIAALILLVSLASFGLGRLSVIWPYKKPIRIDKVGKVGENDKNNDKNISFTQRSDLSNSSSSPKSGRYVASRNGNSYHYPWCPGALKIKEENKIWFDTKQEAESKGYKPAANCDGL